MAARPTILMVKLISLTSNAKNANKILFLLIILTLTFVEKDQKFKENST